MLAHLYKLNIQSVLVEGGAQLLQSFIDADLWNEARVITGNIFLEKGIKSPDLNSHPDKVEKSGDDVISYYFNNK